METFWEEVRRRLTDSVSELDLIEQMQLLLEKGSDESFEGVSYGLHKAKEKLSQLNERGRIYSRSGSKRSDGGRGRNHASMINEGEFWTVEWDREIVRMKGSKGVRLIAVLVDNPGREFHVMDLERHERKPEPGGDDIAFGHSDAGPMLDDRTKNSYRARLLDLRGELEEAERFNDVFRSCKIKEEMAIITTELARACGLYGKSRLALSNAERARVRVTLAVKGTIEKISKFNSAVGWHLGTSVRTGAFCMYRPAPIARDNDGFQGSDV